MLTRSNRISSIADADGPGWPVGIAEQMGLFERLTERLSSAIDGLGERDDQRIAMLAMPSIAAFSFYQADLASAVARNASETIAAAPDAAYLVDERIAIPEPQDVGQVITMQAPRFAAARSALRSASWTPLRRLPRALVRPDAVAIAHNELLRFRAKKFAIGFCHAARLMGRRDPKAAARPTDRIREALVPAMTSVLDVPPAIARRFAAMTARQAALDLGRAAVDLAGLREADLPRHIWSGTGGYWPSRAICLEVMRRGGTVTRFDHAGGIGLRRREKLAAEVELAASTDFVVATPAIAARLSPGRLNVLLPVRSRPRLHAEEGDPSFLKSLAPRSKAARRRVLYGPPPRIGARRAFPPIQPDHVLADWEMRLVRMLTDMPVDLILRPHPEGLLKGRPHPLSALAHCAAEPYEALLRDADILLYDYVQTTTFMMGLCSDRPIVLLDTGLRIFADDIEGLIDARCLRVPVTFDEANRPQVDAGLLRAALRDAPEKADPAPFREFLLGGLAA